LGKKNTAAEVETKRIYDNTLSEDSSAFDYDGVYESFKAAEPTHSLSQASTKDKAPVNINYRSKSIEIL
jgi:hypothetical protein